MNDEAFTAWRESVDSTVNRITLDPSFTILVIEDLLYKDEGGHGRLFVQLEKVGTDAITGGPWVGRGERLFLTPLMTPSELVNSIFDLYRLFHEHEARESFRWDNARVYSPHRSMAGLKEGARKLDLRENEINEKPN